MAATGELNVYGLPNWIGGWVSYPVPVTLVATLGGVKVGSAMAEAQVEGHPDRRSFSLTFDRPVEPGAVRSGLLEVRPMMGESLGRPLPPWSTLRGVDALLASFANISSWRRRLGPCTTPFAGAAEARLPAPAPMDLYLATKVVGFYDIFWCHARWREIAVLERLSS